MHVFLNLQLIAFDNFHLEAKLLHITVCQSKEIIKMGDPVNIPQKIAIRRRSSLFLSDASASASPLPFKPSYEKQLKNEIDSWSRLVRSKIQEINEHKKNNIELDVSLLSDEQRRYLNAGPILDDYVQEANAFGILVERYIQRKSFLARRYELILSEARAQLDNKAVDLIETQLLSEKLE
ncbi:uncharacterized protein LOC135697808 [Ochlerotatus camptorhynchus]|uniref:uncharacterized protein LOC135697808 n=1 Tax=Ochlerotatus camptorhynchus TaxID=644619 RepID=UPI0031D48EE1